MRLFGSRKEERSKDYREGYQAGKEFIDMVSGFWSLTDEQANAQWDAVERGHSREYVEGYADYMDRPWWKIW